MKNSPELHIDMSSNLFFVTIVSAFLRVNFYDFRPVDINIKNFTSGSADLLNLPFNDSSIDSLSCLHVIEHIGLGRYGDTLDPAGDLKAINELKRVMKYNGNLLLVVPIGNPKIVFNAHRIYSYKQILEYFKDFELIEFSLITDNKQYEDFIINANEEIANDQEYGCGCFWFRKNI
jgi:ubiquinone/menaquinone biosynthesis C-methylase UbiE